MKIGDKVKLLKSPNTFGRVRYIGEVTGTSGTWIGVELSKPVGKNDGSTKGKRYFQCDPNHGLFVRSEALQVVSEARSKNSSTAKSQSVAKNASNQKDKSDAEEVAQTEDTNSSAQNQGVTSAPSESHDTSTPSTESQSEAISETGEPTTSLGSDESTTKDQSQDVPPQTEPQSQEEVQATTEEPQSQEVNTIAQEEPQSVTTTTEEGLQSEEVKTTATTTTTTAEEEANAASLLAERNEGNVHIVICGPAPKHYFKFNWGGAKKKGSKKKHPKGNTDANEDSETLIDGNTNDEGDDEEEADDDDESEEALPEDVFHKIFSYLGPKDLCAARLVCHEWKKMCEPHWNELLVNRKTKEDEPPIEETTAPSMPVHSDTKIIIDPTKEEEEAVRALKKTAEPKSEPLTARVVEKKSKPTITDKDIHLLLRMLEKYLLIGRKAAEMCKETTLRQQILDVCEDIQQLMESLASLLKKLLIDPTDPTINTDFAKYLSESKEYVTKLLELIPKVQEVQLNGRKLLDQLGLLKFDKVQTVLNKKLSRLKRVDSGDGSGITPDSDFETSPEIESSEATPREKPVKEEEEEMGKGLVKQQSLKKMTRIKMDDSPQDDDSQMAANKQQPQQQSQFKSPQAADLPKLDIPDLYLAEFLKSLVQRIQTITTLGKDAAGIVKDILLRSQILESCELLMEYQSEALKLIPKLEKDEQSHKQEALQLIEKIRLEMLKLQALISSIASFDFKKMQLFDLTSLLPALGTHRNIKLPSLQLPDPHQRIASNKVKLASLKESADALPSAPQLHRSRCSSSSSNVPDRIRDHTPTIVNSEPKEDEQDDEDDSCKKSIQQQDKKASGLNEVEPDEKPMTTGTQPRSTASIKEEEETKPTLTHSPSLSTENSTSTVKEDQPSQEPAVQPAPPQETPPPVVAAADDEGAIEKQAVTSPPPTLSEDKQEKISPKTSLLKTPGTEDDEDGLHHDATRPSQSKPLSHVGSEPLQKPELSPQFPMRKPKPLVLPIHKTHEVSPTTTENNMKLESNIRSIPKPQEKEAVISPIKHGQTGMSPETPTEVPSVTIAMDRSSTPQSPLVPTKLYLSPLTRPASASNKSPSPSRPSSGGKEKPLDSHSPHSNSSTPKPILNLAFQKVAALNTDLSDNTKSNNTNISTETLAQSIRSLATSVSAMKATSASLEDHVSNAVVQVANKLSNALPVLKNEKLEKQTKQIVSALDELLETTDKYLSHPDDQTKLQLLSAQQTAEALLQSVAARLDHDALNANKEFNKDFCNLSHAIANDIAAQIAEINENPEVAASPLQQMQTKLSADQLVKIVDILAPTVHDPTCKNTIDTTCEKVATAMEDISISNPRTLQLQQQVMKELEILQTVSQPPTNASKFEQIEGVTSSVKSILKNVVGLKLSGSDFREQGRYSSRLKEATETLQALLTSEQAKRSASTSVAHTAIEKLSNIVNSCKTILQRPDRLPTNVKIDTMSSIINDCNEHLLSVKQDKQAVAIREHTVKSFSDSLKRKRSMNPAVCSSPDFQNSYGECISSALEIFQNTSGADELCAAANNFTDSIQNLINLANANEQPLVSDNTSRRPLRDRETHNLVMDGDQTAITTQNGNTNSEPRVDDALQEARMLERAEEDLASTLRSLSCVNTASLEMNKWKNSMTVLQQHLNEMPGSGVIASSSSASEVLGNLPVEALQASFDELQQVATNGTLSASNEFSAAIIKAAQATTHFIESATECSATIVDKMEMKKLVSAVAKTVNQAQQMLEVAMVSTVIPEDSYVHGTLTSQRAQFIEVLATDPHHADKLTPIPTVPPVFEHPISEPPTRPKMLQSLESNTRQRSNSLPSAPEPVQKRPSLQNTPETYPSIPSRPKSREGPIKQRVLTSLMEEEQGYVPPQPTYKSTGSDREQLLPMVGGSQRRNSVAEETERFAPKNLVDRQLKLNRPRSSSLNGAQNLLPGPSQDSQPSRPRLSFSSPKPRSKRSDSMGRPEKTLTDEGLWSIPAAAICYVCASTANLFACPQCHETYYCSVAHQKLDAAAHKTLCASRTGITEDDASDDEIVIG